MKKIVTYEKVLNAVTELKKRNIKITSNAIKDIIGSGSHTTIYKYLKEIKAKEIVGVLDLETSNETASRKKGCESPVNTKVMKLLKIIEELKEENAKLKEEIRQLKDKKCQS